ncbi:hypothetical protein HUS70_07350 [Pandoraea nosoerga]|uniref:hypothetical protein n=1 Tax=Pandoraea nosoerga TaxID=2508296 RepID=UPI0019811B61|nr:hypothetical protein [Pandoraea nosoerga]MBN4665449.1 hypothetical protein [Pandoraea nosoerga]MBN4674974.1 hypothetical protein [Pandoraea nosoerga]MBN4680290.1 hypothetical protein [Pandoraea nosoerga]MBN4744477.1 hypothetical protein [Pandoraea nosoerga]
MATNDFLTFAGGSGANVLSQADYAALTSILSNGFSSGVAQSAQVNKVLRQASIMSAVLAQFAVDLTGKNAVDDGTTASILAMLKAAVSAQSLGVVGQCRNLVINVPAASSTASVTADEIIVESALGGQRYCLANFNKTVNLASVGAGGMDTGSAPASGFVGLYAIFNPTTGASALLAVNATSAKVPQVYGGANMPTGYTASALVSVWSTNASGQFTVGYQYDRTREFPIANALTTSTAQATPTAFSIASIVPPNAVSFGGTAATSNNTPSAATSAALSASAASIGQTNFNVTSATANTGLSVGFKDMPIITQQTGYYSMAVTAGVGLFSVSVGSYRI